MLTFKELDEASRTVASADVKVYPSGRKMHKQIKVGSDDYKEPKDDKDDVPFDPPYKSAPENVKDKSGAVHTPQSRVRHLARLAIQTKKDKKDE